LKAIYILSKEEGFFLRNIHKRKHRSADLNIFVYSIIEYEEKIVKKNQVKVDHMDVHMPYMFIRISTGHINQPINKR
jgi:hypothetical protein